MKRTALIILSAIYVLFSTGMHVEIDKCCEKLASIWILEVGDQNCQKNVAESSCCSHHTPCGDDQEIPGHKDCDTFDIILSIEESHRVPVKLMIDDFKVEFQPEFVEPFYIEQNLTSDWIYVRKDHHPPDPLPIYLLNSSLTYYG